jgi:hypothetical protein
MSISLNPCEFFKEDKEAYKEELLAIDSSKEWIDVSYTNDEVPSICDGTHIIYFGIWANGEPLIWAVQEEDHESDQIDLGSFTSLTDAIAFCDNRGI